MLRQSVYAAAAAASLLAGPVGAQTLKVAVGKAEGGPEYFALDNFATRVTDATGLKTRVFPMSLLSLSEIPPGVTDGIADVGYVITPYYAKEFAEVNMVAETAMLVSAGTPADYPGAAMAGAITEYIMGCTDCGRGYAAQNQVYLGSAASGDYLLLCTSPLSTLADLSGTKLRAGSGNYSRWAETFGATPVSMPGNEMYEALSQKVVDCTIASAAELTAGGLFDVVRGITVGAPGGVYAGLNTVNMNRGTWEGLDTKQKTAVLHAAAEAQADFVWKTSKDSADNLAAAPGKGIEVMDAAPEVTAKTSEFVKADMATIAAQYTEKYGIKDAEAKLARMPALVEKWKGLTAGMRDDRDALAKLYWDEIFSKIDPETYPAVSN
ncbi:TRAP transporter substrate-binding protein DctP [Aureimonas flava]|uniref:TRAP transporter substrate-binding protein DctP n=1 Tax=Aureimonas flava TaxID=2320271 RepID=UPI00145A00C0|nr:TRAP transporter substrate-binding protein DctP [Aureimonas flava]